MTEYFNMTSPVDNEAVAKECTLAYRPPTNLFDKAAVHFFSIICFTMSVALILIIGASAGMRYILKLDMYGYEEWIKIFAFWLYFIGAGFGAYAGTHVSADLVQSYLPSGGLKNFIIFIRTVITLGITLLFTWYGWDFFWFAFLGPLGTGIAIPKTVAWRIPLWTAYLAIFLGLFFMAYYFFGDMIKAAKTLLYRGKTA